MDDRKKRIIVFSVTGLFILIAVPGYYMNWFSAHSSRPRDMAVEPAAPTTRSPAPNQVVVPDTTSQNIPVNVAKPNFVDNPAQQNVSGYRRFDLKVFRDHFAPDTVIVEARDTVRLNITAVDGDYDFYQPDYGVRQPLPRGKTTPVEFGASSAGAFTFYCAKCDGPEKGPVGTLIVVQQK